MDKSTNKSISLPMSLWNWLDLQPGGRSENVRRLIENARTENNHAVVKIKQTAADFLLGRVTADEAMEAVTSLAVEL